MMDQQEALNELKEALACVPEQYHKSVARALVHDIEIIARTINMVNHGMSA